MMYYRVAWKSNRSSVWQWKSTKLTSLEALFRFLRMYSSIPQDHLRVFASSSLESMEEMLMCENKGWESTSITAEEFLCERGIHIGEKTQRVSEQYAERGVGGREQHCTAIPERAERKCVGEETGRG